VELFATLGDKDAGVLKGCLPSRVYPAGTPIFLDGDHASSAMLVERGRVRISVNTLDGEQVLGDVGPSELFGEIGLLFECRRTATAVAVEETSVIELPKNSMKILEESCGPQMTIQIMENLIKLTGDRLRRQDLHRSFEVRPEYRDDLNQKLDLATRHLEEVLPKADLINCFSCPRELSAGEVLCTEGDVSDGFYFIQTGSLEVTRTGDDGQSVRLGDVKAPALVGEIGYFSGEPRSATVTATEPVSYFFFWGPQLEALKKNKPAEAAQVLFTAAQLAICLLYSRR
jgi:CRP-like cAMP-binding protein